MALQKNFDISVTGNAVATLTYHRIHDYRDCSNSLIDPHVINTEYAKGDCIIDTGNYDNVYFESQNQGTSAGSKPVFDKTIGGITTDNDINWLCKERPDKCCIIIGSWKDRDSAKNSLKTGEQPLIGYVELNGLNFPISADAQEVKSTKELLYDKLKNVAKKVDYGIYGYLDLTIGTTDL